MNSLASAELAVAALPTAGAIRIAYVVKRYPRFSETFIVSEILAREAQGEHIEVFALRPTVDSHFHAELALVQAPVRFVRRNRTEGDSWGMLRDSVAAHPTLRPRLASVLDDLLQLEVSEAAQAVDLAASLIDRQIDHVHAHFATQAAVLTRIAARLAGVPYSFTAHAKDIFHESVDHERLGTLIADSAYVVTVSEYNRAFLVGLFPHLSEQIRVVYNGIALDRFSFTPEITAARASDREPLQIAAVGRLVEKKGFGVLLDAVAALHASGRTVQVTIAGDGDERASLRAQIERLRLGGTVRFVGSLPQAQIAQLLRASDVFVAPCVVGADGNADGLPTVLLEAMATGVPVVSTPVTGIPEAVIDGITGVLTPTGDAQALASALASLDDSFDERARDLARAARTLIEERFDARSQAAALRALTEAVMTKKKKANPAQHGGAR